MVRHPVAIMLVALTGGGVLVACGGGDTTTAIKTVTAPATGETAADTTSETTTEKQARYPQKIRDAYMRACEATSGGETASCECVLEKLEETVSLEEFKRIDADLRAGGVAPQSVRDALSACVSGG